MPIQEWVHCDETGHTGTDRAKEEDYATDIIIIIALLGYKPRNTLINRMHRACQMVHTNYNRRHPQRRTALRILGNPEHSSVAFEGRSRHKSVECCVTSFIDSPSTTYLR